MSIVSFNSFQFPTRPTRYNRSDANFLCSPTCLSCSTPVECLHSISPDMACHDPLWHQTPQAHTQILISSHHTTNQKHYFNILIQMTGEILWWKQFPYSLTTDSNSKYWNSNDFILMTPLSMKALENVKMTTSIEANDEEFYDIFIQCSVSLWCNLQRPVMVISCYKTV